MAGGGQAGLGLVIVPDLEWGVSCPSLSVQEQPPGEMETIRPLVQRGVRGGLLENIIPALSESQRRSLAPSRRGREARNASRRNSTSKDRRFETVVYVEGGRGRISILVVGDEPGHLDVGPWMKGRGIGHCSLVDIPHSSPTWPSK